MFALFCRVEGTAARSIQLACRAALYSTQTTIEKPTLTLFTKSGDCSLCDDMKEALEPYIHNFEYNEVDISQEENKYWKNRYRYEIPVIHVDGKLFMKHRFDKEKLEGILSAYNNTK